MTGKFGDTNLLEHLQQRALERTVAKYADAGASDEHRAVVDIPDHIQLRATWQRDHGEEY